MNIFLSTKLEKPEEDRLTCALMCVLEHSDRAVLNEFLKLATGESAGITPDERVEFEVQIPFTQSRPDARIETNDQVVVIETKRFENLDERQLRNHWDDLRDAERPTVLLALTGGRTHHQLVDCLTDGDTPTNRRARHVTWSQVLEMLVGLEKEYSQDTLTGFLLRQMGEYLATLGYDYFKGISMDNVLKYADAIALTAKYRTTTGKQLVKLLNILGERIDAALPTSPMARKINSFGPPHVDGDLKGTRVPFEFLDFEPKQVGVNLRLRVGLFAVLPDKLYLSYYMTYSKGAGQDALTVWFSEHRDDIETELAPLHCLGFIDQKKTIYHISRQMPLEPSSPILCGDETALDTLATKIADFFRATLKWVDLAIAEANGKPGGAPS